MNSKPGGMIDIPAVGFSILRTRLVVRSISIARANDYAARCVPEHARRYRSFPYARAQCDPKAEGGVLCARTTLGVDIRSTQRLCKHETRDLGGIDSPGHDSGSVPDAARIPNASFGHGYIPCGCCALSLGWTR